MSAEATNHVWRHCTLATSQKFVLLAMAHESKQRYDPFFCKISQRDLAKKCGVSKRRIEQVIADLKLSGHLRTTCGGYGDDSATYSIQVRYLQPTTEISGGDTTEIYFGAQQSKSTLTALPEGENAAALVQESPTVVPFVLPDIPRPAALGAVLKSA